MSSRNGTLSLAVIRICLAIAGVSTLALAGSPATRPAAPASAPATAPATPAILVNCLILKDGEVISRPTILIESGREATIEVGNTSSILLGHEMDSGTQVNLTATLDGDAIVLKGEALISELDQDSPQQTPGATWALQRGCRWVFQIRSTDPNRWYVTPKPANGCEIRLLARANAR